MKIGKTTSKSTKEGVVVHEGETGYILLERLNGDRIPISVDKSLADELQKYVDFQRVSSDVQDILDHAFETLPERYKGRISAVADKVSVHDGQVMIRVAPTKGLFDIDLSRDLNDFSWELQDQLCEALGESTPRVLFGFRQELLGVEKRAS